MTSANDNIRVVIPLSIRRRNGRPRIMPPENVLDLPSGAQEPHILKALGRAWAWRRRLENGDVATAGELARLDGVSDRFVSRTIRLAYLSPDVLECLVVKRAPVAVALPDFIAASQLPWVQQSDRIMSDPVKLSQGVDPPVVRRDV